MTHFATADDDPAFIAEQLDAFTPWARALKAAHPELLVHAANSAATLREPAARFDLVRCGIAVYGMDPFQDDPAAHGLEPALSLVSYVAEVKDAAPGQSAGYGRPLRRRAPDAHRDAADRLRRRRPPRPDQQRRRARRAAAACRSIGTVSMDNITVDLGDGAARRRAPRRS